MTKELKIKIQKVSAVIFLILLVDQFSKIWIKTHLIAGESIHVTNWFHILFVENNGMAFGMELFDKGFLTVFRIIAVIAIGYYIYHTIKKEFNFGFTIAICLIFTGALGNIIDCVFYGVWFDSSVGRVATFLSGNEGYAPLFYGKVVDMLYFPLIDTVWPSWIPWIGGTTFTFFDPVFNLADSAICIGVFYILIFQRKYFMESSEKEETKEPEEVQNLC
jgi:signal peptidase II